MTLAIEIGFVGFSASFRRGIVIGLGLVRFSLLFGRLFSEIEYLRRALAAAEIEVKRVRTYGK